VLTKCINITLFYAALLKLRPHGANVYIVVDVIIVIVIVVMTSSLSWRHHKRHGRHRHRHRAVRAASGTVSWLAKIGLEVAWNRIHIWSKSNQARFNNIAYHTDHRTGTVHPRVNVALYYKCCMFFSWNRPIYLCWYFNSLSCMSKVTLGTVRPS